MLEKEVEFELGTKDINFNPMIFQYHRFLFQHLRMEEAVHSL